MASRKRYLPHLTRIQDDPPVYIEVRSQEQEDALRRLLLNQKEAKPDGE